MCVNTTFPQAYTLPKPLCVSASAATRRYMFFREIATLGILRDLGRTCSHFPRHSREGKEREGGGREELKTHSVSRSNGGENVSKVAYVRRRVETLLSAFGCETVVFARLHMETVSHERGRGGKVSCDILLPPQCGSSLPPWNAGIGSLRWVSLTAPDDLCVLHK